MNLWHTFGMILAVSGESIPLANKHEFESLPRVAYRRALQVRRGFFAMLTIKETS